MILFLAVFVLGMTPAVLHGFFSMQQILKDEKGKDKVK